MIHVNVHVDDIQDAVAQYRKAQEVVDQNVSDLSLSITEELCELSPINPLRWISPLGYLSMLALISGKSTVQEVIDDITENTGISYDFKYYDTGSEISQQLERLMMITREDTEYFTLSGEHLDFVCLFSATKEIIGE